jgi:hypothetical protein
VEGGGHLRVELRQHFVALPEVVRVALHLLEVAARHAARVREQVGDDEDAALAQHLVRLGGRRPVRRFRHDAHARTDPPDVVRRDLLLQRRGDQHVDVLFDPRLARQHFIATLESPLPIDAAEAVRHRQQLLEIDARGPAEREGLLLRVIPRGDAQHLHPDADEQLDRVLRDVAEALHRGDRLARLHAELAQCFANRVDHAVAGRFLPPLRAAHLDRLAGDEAGIASAVDGLELVEHPHHVLRVGHHVRRGDVAERAGVARNLTDPPAADLFGLVRAELVGIAHHAALAAAEGDVDDGAFPGHPHRQGADGVGHLHRMKADAALAGAARVVVLHAETAEDAARAVVHADGDGEVVFAQGRAEQIAGRPVEAERVGDAVELPLGGEECVVGRRGADRLGFQYEGHALPGSNEGPIAELSRLQ